MSYESGVTSRCGHPLRLRFEYDSACLACEVEQLRPIKQRAVEARSAGVSQSLPPHQAVWQAARFILGESPPPAPGDRLVDGGIPGTVIRCAKCSGDGVLLDPDPGATDHLRVEPSGGPHLLVDVADWLSPEDAAYDTAQTPPHPIRRVWRDPDSDPAAKCARATGVPVEVIRRVLRFVFLEEADPAPMEWAEVLARALHDADCGCDTYDQEEDPRYIKAVRQALSSAEGSTCT